MAKLLIADRDGTERTGLQWFIASKHIPFEEIREAKTVHEMIAAIEAERPEAIYLELEMVPDDQFHHVKYLLRTNVERVICITTEAVFERALQALELNAMSLFVKPVSMENLQSSLFQAAKESAPPEKKASDPLMKEGITSEALFIEQAITGSAPSFLLFKPEKASLNKQLYHWLQNGYFPYPARLYPLSSMVAGIFEVPGERENELLQVEGQRLLQQWQEQHQNRLSLAIHPGSLPVRSIHEMYVRTKETMQMEFFKGYQQIHWVNESRGFHMIDPFLTPDEQRLWVTALEKGEKKVMKDWLYVTFTQFPHGYPIPDLLRIKLTSILAQLRRFMHTYKLDENVEIEANYHEVFQTILYQPVLFHIVQEILLFALELIDKAEEQKKNHVFDVVERGLQYIERSFKNPLLTLDDVAKAVDRSPSYFSSLLAKKKGKSFREVLNDCRLSCAKKLLMETNLTIKEIAFQTGFSDPNYFSKRFKETAGSTPRAFRRENKKNIR
ncbi:Two-component response regulator, YesN/AraC family, consists of REC and AraC-type DNA-binding domains [Evansella caseinilytica]|uniref:Two-component response regulator, YesN/AraC family, consists of REC and AraC-type DNA-binding domains n=1 Tax=Evansella caseinilytica TaxID=1503961 RepID=A0A1H3SCC4_9BACI|nr:response regulator transcription factor [Evansella caseinilytica]SDZ35338.1 Two-component response regulator, YesN/AraC family, consists of REC and AraC-type DNA-binding domains [Evansella caseinilytica]